MYLYSFDEHRNPTVVHAKGRIVKNDGCVEWAGALHEDFKHNRDLNIKMIEGIEVLHLSNEERFERAKLRNLEIAQKQLEDSPDDPRSYWNVANSLKALLRDAEAIEMFDKFMGKSNSEDEKYIASLRMAESYWNLGESKKAIETCQYAIGTKPSFPDAYHLLGDIYLESGQNQKAIEMYLHGLHKAPPQHKILVFNPRDYDYRPMMNMAKAYFNISLPSMSLPLLKACSKIMPENKDLKEKIKIIKEEADKFNEVGKIVEQLRKETDTNKIKDALSEIDMEMQAHPAICNLRNTRLIKKESSGRDLVFYCGYTDRVWTPDSIKEGIGGSEEAIIHLAEGLSDKWNVTVYNNCGYKQKKFGNVTYKPYWSWNYRDKQDVVILWRSAKALDYDINSKVYLDLHDVIQEGELNESRMSKCSGIFVKSKFHRSLFPNIPDDKFFIIPNGIVAEDFKKTEKKEQLLLNTSSPDRGLKAFVDSFEEIKKEVPEVKAKWCYGWGVWDTVYAEDASRMEWKKELQEKMKRIGIEELGMISHKEVAKLYKRAKILAYPSEFAEIDMISLTKALASGCIPVTTNFAAMGEKAKYGGIYLKSKKNKDNWCPGGKFDFSIENNKEWVKEIIKILKGGQINIKREEVLKNYSWDKIISDWDKKLYEV